MRTRLQRPDLGAEAGGGVRLLGRGGDQILLARIKQHLALQIKIAGVGLLVVHMAIGLAEEKLPVDIQPGGGIRRQQSFAIGARSANAISGQQIGQIQSLSQDRRGDIAVVHRAAGSDTGSGRS